jgi:lactoylglutathione lyase
MHIAHIAIWAKEVECLKAFYECYFGAKSSAKYINPHTQFQSYFLVFTSGARLELMSRSDMLFTETPSGQERYGYAHLAMSVGSESAVDALTKRLVNDGYQRLEGPRLTGDGYYESIVLDPEGNHIEITI